jgi:HK97 family phage prohead protease
VSEQNSRPQRENLIRAVNTGLEFRSSSDDDLGPGYLGLLRVLFSPVNEWTEINSMWEGRFLERFAPGAWSKTIRDQMGKVKALFQHGMDPTVGDKPLGPIRKLEETESGGYGEIALLDTSYNRDLLPGLKDGLYGASHRFKMVREQRDERPERSEENPDGIEERTIIEARLYEFGPVTFPAYEGASAGVRSLTDEFIQGCFREDPQRLRQMFEQATEIRVSEPEKQDDAPSEDGAGESTTSRSDAGDSTTPSDERRVTDNAKPTLLGLYGKDASVLRKEQRSWHRR